MNLIKWIASTALRGLGFEHSGAPPDIPKYVYVAAPHTSYWDGLLMVLYAYSMDLRPKWLVKQEAYRFPFRAALDRLGAIPVDRSRASGTVQSVVDAFAAADRLMIVIPASGTRSKRPYWKSGFYHIARGANVPVALGFLDYPSRTGGFGPTIKLTGDVRADMDRIRAFYKDKVGLHPERTSRVRIKEEDIDGELAPLDPGT